MGRPFRALRDDRCVGERGCIRKPSGCVTRIIACVKVWTGARDFMDFQKQNCSCK